MNGSVYVGQKALSLTEYDKSAPITGVILWVDDENCYEAGDETGTVIEQDCPYASQAMANNLLSILQGYSYQGLEANGAKVSPISELGDGLTVDGLYTQLAYQNIRFSTGEVMDVAAPGSNETLHEYKTEGETTKQFNHQIAETRSQITKTSEEILLKVENELEGLSSSFSVQLQQIQSQVTGLDGQMSSITQTVSSITSRVDGLEGDFTEVSVTLDGLTVTDETGETVINGSKIQTKNLFVSAANITGTLTANQINLTGAITWGDLAIDSKNQITSAQDTASSAYQIASNANNTANAIGNTVSAWTYPGSTMINGNMLMTGTVMATQLLGGYVGLLNQHQQVVGNMTIGMATTGYAVELNSSGGLRLSSSGNFWVDSTYGTLGITASGVISGGNCVPGAGSRYSLGAPGLNWTQVYADNSTIVTSDRNKKTDITYDMSQYSALFDLLKPTPYKLAGGTSGRVHLGLISQDVEKELSEVGLSSLEFAGFIKSTTEDGDLYALRYEEFIPLLIYEVQNLKKRVAELEAA